MEPQKTASTVLYASLLTSLARFLILVAKPICNFVLMGVMLGRCHWSIKSVKANRALCAHDTLLDIRPPSGTWLLDNRKSLLRSRSLREYFSAWCHFNHVVAFYSLKVKNAPQTHSHCRLYDGEILTRYSSFLSEVLHCQDIPNQTAHWGHINSTIVTWGVNGFHGHLNRKIENRVKKVIWPIPTPLMSSGEKSS